MFNWGPGGLELVKTLEKRFFRSNYSQPNSEKCEGIKQTTNFNKSLRYFAFMKHK